MQGPVVVRRKPRSEMAGLSDVFVSCTPKDVCKKCLCRICPRRLECQLSEYRPLLEDDSVVLHNSVSDSPDGTRSYSPCPLVSRQLGAAPEYYIVVSCAGDDEGSEAPWLRKLQSRV